MKTPSEIINKELPEHIRVRYWNNCNKLPRITDENELYRGDPLGELLNNSFSWLDSEEGIEYWIAVWNGIRDEEVLNKLIKK